MATYKQEEKELAKLCVKCDGLCCLGSKLSVSSKELSKLSKKHKFESAVLSSKEGSLNVILFKEGKCPFLGEKKGLVRCILSGKDRPLSCRLFPITFFYEKDEVEFYFSSYCPYKKSASELLVWVKKTTGEAKAELKTWGAGEKAYRSSYHKKIHKKFVCIKPFTIKLSEDKFSKKCPR
ncbi:MAG: YkgJ family cysteine cluster protein [Candidatus Micrarchaeota archaeon]